MESTKDRMKGGKKIGSYVLMDVLGEGEFGIVYSAVSTQDNEKYAVKCQNKKMVQNTEVSRRLFHTEVGVMHKIQHPNILHLYDLLESSNNYYLITDFCDQGDFNNYLRKKNVRFLEERHAVNCLAQIANAFRELRKNKIMHLDFKLANILVHGETLKIGDFGLAKRGRDVARTIVGTYMTMAPELLSSNGESSYTGKADLWSVGFVYYQMLFGEIPFFGLSPNEIFAAIKKKSGKLTFPREISPASMDLLNRLLQMVPEERIDWADFFSHPLFNAAPQKSRSLKSLRDFVKPEDPVEIGKPASLDDAPPINVSAEFSKNREALLAEKRRRDTSREIARPDGRGSLDGGGLRLERASSNTSALPERLATLVQPTAVKEEPVNERDLSSLERAQTCREAARRYYHEKNKILFVISSVRGLRKLMQCSWLEAVHDRLFAIAALLFRKAIVLNDLTLASLEAGNNIFELPGFADFLDSELLNDVETKFRNDKLSFAKYMAHLLNSENWKNFPAEEKERIAAADQESISLPELDDKVSAEYGEVRDFELDESEEHRRDFSLALVSVLYSIDCETYFPYKLKGGKFEWPGFYDLHENMSDQQLLSIIGRK